MKQGPNASKGTEQATWGLREAQALSQRPVDTSKQPLIQSDMRTGHIGDMRSRTLVITPLSKAQQAADKDVVWG